MANVPVNPWGHDLLQQQNIHMNIPALTEMDHKLTLISGKDVIRYPIKQSLPVQSVQKHRTTTGNLSEVV